VLQSSVAERRSAQRVQSPWLPPQQRPPSQALLAQSASLPQSLPGAQRPQLGSAPPQSTSLSLPSKAPSPQALHTPATQLVLAQSEP
jgi:hypothetical protein